MRIHFFLFVLFFSTLVRPLKWIVSESQGTFVVTLLSKRREEKSHISSFVLSWYYQSVTARYRTFMETCVSVFHVNMRTWLKAQMPLHFSLCQIIKLKKKKPEECFHRMKWFNYNSHFNKHYSKTSKQIQLKMSDSWTLAISIYNCMSNITIPNSIWRWIPTSIEL